MASLWRAACFSLPVLRGAQGFGLQVAEDSPPYGHPDPGFTYPEHENFTLWLVEEFQTPIDVVNDPIWTYSDGALGEGAIRYQKEGISFKDGKMYLTAEEIDDTVPQQSCSHAEAGHVQCKGLRSGELRTRHNMFRYGRYEVRMKAPTVADNDVNIDGNYIATLFTYRDGKFRHWREIDIEVLGDLSLFSNVLYAENRTIYNGEFARGSSEKKGVTLRQAFHDYAFEWTPDKITWYLDGEQVRVFEGDAGVPIPDLSTKIMMSLWIWIDDAWSFGGPDGANNRYPFAVEYEWFRFYKWDGDTTYPCSGMDTSCLTEDDQYLSGNNPCDGIAMVGDVHRPDVCSNALCPSADNFSDNFIQCEAAQTPAPTAEPTPEPSSTVAPAPTADNTMMWIVLVCAVLVCSGLGVFVANQMGSAGTDQAAEGVQLDEA